MIAQYITTESSKENSLTSTIQTFLVDLKCQLDTFKKFHSEFLMLINPERINDEMNRIENLSGCQSESRYVQFNHQIQQTRRNRRIKHIKPQVGSYENANINGVEIIHALNQISQTSATTNQGQR